MSLRRILRSRAPARSDESGEGPAAERLPAGDTTGGPALDCTPEAVQRWNDEWIEYLRREWPHQLAPWSDYPDTPPLPAEPRDLLGLGLGHGGPLSLYCDADALTGCRVMELGCGCGNLGKLLARYVDTYLGVDYSTLALKVARLVSPPNCTYVHVADEPGLRAHEGAIDTVVGRFFWIHQNARLAGLNLDFLARFLRPGGRLYADFYWPDPAIPQGLVLTPDAPLSPAHPSATFRYDSQDVTRLLARRPFRRVREEISSEMQRRFVVFERIERSDDEDGKGLGSTSRGS